MKWKVGDKVRLSGTSWGDDPTDEYFQGAELRVTGVDEGGHVRLGKGRYHWGIYEGWEIELVAREEETMSVDFSEVNVGDKVRLTRENGDESTFTVKNKSRGFISSDSQNFSTKLWDTLEIVERAFKPVPGLYTHYGSNCRFVLLPDGREYFTSATGYWNMANSPAERTEAYEALKERGDWRREITF